MINTRTGIADSKEEKKLEEKHFHFSVARKKLQGRKFDEVLSQIEELNEKWRLASVYLINCNLSPVDPVTKEENILKLITILQRLPQLTELDLSYNEIKNDGAVTIAAVLRDGFPRLKKLNLTDNGISREGILELINAAGQIPYPFKLILSKNSINNLNLYQQITKYAGKYGNLTLELEPREEKIELIQLDEPKNLESLFLRLQINPVSKLKITSTRLGDEDVDQLVQVIEACQGLYLKELDLSWSKLTKVGAEKLLRLAQSCPFLNISINLPPEEFEFKKNHYFHDFITRLKVFPASKIKLSDCGMGDDEIKQLIDVFLRNPSLQLKELDLSKNKITDMGAARLCEFLQKKPLVHVKTQGNNITPQSLEFKRVTVDNVKELLNRLMIFPVKTLSIGQIDKPALNLLIEAFKQNKILSLHEIDFSGMIFSPENADFLFMLAKQCPDIRIISKLPVRELEYKKGDNFDDLLTQLRAYPIKKIKANSCSISDAEIKQLVKVIDCNQRYCLEHINLSKNNVMDGGAANLMDLLNNNPRLSINLKENQIGTKEFEFKHVSAENIKELIHKLMLYPVSKLKINKIGLSELNELFKKLDQAQSLREIDLTEMAIPSEFETLLLKIKQSGINVKCSPQALEFQDLTLSGDNLSIVFNKLNLYPVIKFSLTRCEFEEADIKGIFALLAKTQANFLKELDLSENDIDIDEVKALADLIKQCQHLERLNLAKNKISDSGISMIADTLRNSKLIMLNLQDNPVFADGIDAVKRLAKKHPSLKKIDLTSNSPDDDDKSDDKVKVTSTLMKSKGAELKEPKQDKRGKSAGSALSSSQGSLFKSKATKTAADSETVEDDFLLIDKKSIPSL